MTSKTKGSKGHGLNYWRVFFQTSNAILKSLAGSCVLRLLLSTFSRVLAGVGVAMILSMEEILLFGHVKHHDVWGAKAMTIQLFLPFHRKECVEGGSLRMQLCSFAGFWKTQLLFYPFFFLLGNQLTSFQRMIYLICLFSLLSKLVDNHAWSGLVMSCFFCWKVVIALQISMRYL